MSLTPKRQSFTSCSAILVAPERELIMRPAGNELCFGPPAVAEVYFIATLQKRMASLYLLVLLLLLLLLLLRLCMLRTRFESTHPGFFRPKQIAHA